MAKKKIEVETPVETPQTPQTPAHTPHEVQRARIGAGYLVCPTCGEQID